MSERRVSATRFVAAEPREAFALLQDPAKHASFDGSGMVQASRGASQLLTLGSRFGMSMKMGPLPYRISNRVVEFEQDRLIAWAHLGKHRWRYEIAPVEGGCEVTETFDWSTARSPQFIERSGYPERNLRAIEATLDRLASMFASSEAPTMTPEVHYYWRPGCPFCSMLRRGLDKRGIATVDHNIWEDPEAAAVVRSHARGNETVPTVVIDGVGLVNPSAREVTAFLERSGT